MGFQVYSFLLAGSRGAAPGKMRVLGLTAGNFPAQKQWVPCMINQLSLSFLLVACGGILGRVPGISAGLWYNDMQHAVAGVRVVAANPRISSSCGIN